MRIVKLEPLSIPRRFKTFVSQSLGRLNTDFVTVPINQCRHYCGFRYGAEFFNPYQNYIVGLHQKQSLDSLRQSFEYFLMYYRPRNFGEVFNIELSRHIPLWVYPWNNSKNFNPNNGWLDDIDKVPDLITHFCEMGIKVSRIKEEYFWLERAYNLISTTGYQPTKFSHIEVFELIKNDQRIFIVKDGNHRLSALAALGYKEVIVKRYLSERVQEKDSQKWFQVRLGTYSEKEALTLFNAYFVGVNRFKRSNEPARILEY